MHIGHASLPPAAAGHGHRADNATAQAMNAIAIGTTDDAAEDGEHADSTLAGAAKVTATPTAPLSQTNLAAALGAQSDAGVESGGASAAAVAAPGRSGETPAARARALIAENPGLADRPFGHIVFALARGLEVDLGTPDPAATDGEEGAAAVAAVTDDEAGEETSGAVGETTEGPAESDVGPSAGTDGGIVDVASAGDGDDTTVSEVGPSAGTDGGIVDVASTGDGEATTESDAVAPEDAGIFPLPDASLTVAESLEDQLLDLLEGDEETTV